MGSSRIRNLNIPVFLLILVASLFSNLAEAHAQTPDLPVVHAVLFWMDGCPHCHEVLDSVLPPLQEKYGPQLEVLLVQVVSMEDINGLYDVAAIYGLSRGQVGVPLLVMGENVLIGSLQIPEELPGLIEHYLAQGGVALPDIPEIEYFLSKEPGPDPTHTATSPVTDPFPTSTTSQPHSTSTALVQAVMLNTPDCHDCQIIAASVLKLARQDYNGQFTVKTIDIVTSQDVDYLYQIASAYGIAKEDLGLPLIIIADQVLIEGEIPDRLPALIEHYLQAGGTKPPQIPTPVIPTVSPTPAIPADTPTPAQLVNPAEMHSNGFNLAIITLGLMVTALVYSLASFALGKTFGLPAWAEWLIPILIVIGIGVAGYLAYVETQAVKAVCGPVGDCNTVQSSPYARLFGVLPVGVLGLLGYLALLAAWLARRWFPNIGRQAALSFWGLAVFAVVFSIYLTYLEPFVIKAVCLWCLASAVIVTLLLLLGTPPAVRHFATPDEGE